MHNAEPNTPTAPLIHPLTERLAAGNVRGSVIRGHLNWVRDHADRAEIIEFFEMLPPQMRSVVSVSWYPFRDLVAVDRAIARQFGRDDVRFLENVGAYAARQTLGGVYRNLRSSSIHEFFRRSVLVRGEMQDFGRARYEGAGESAGRMVCEKDPSYSPLVCAAVAGFHRECIRFHDGSDAEVRESLCQCRGDGSCTFELSWRRSGV